MKFAEMATRAGMVSKPLYTVTEVSKASTIPRRTLWQEIADGRLKSFLPTGSKQGIRIAPEWFDEWFERGVRVGY